MHAVILFVRDVTAPKNNTFSFVLLRLAVKGRTIVLSIHQPRYSIYRLFDSLMMLSMGEVVYHGPTSEALTHFKSIGNHVNKSLYIFSYIFGSLLLYQHGSKMQCCDRYQYKLKMFTSLSNFGYISEGISSYW